MKEREYLRNTFMKPQNMFFFASVDMGSKYGKLFLIKNLAQS